MIKNNQLTALILAVLVLLLPSCAKQKDSDKITSIDYADTAYWYSMGNEGHAADVFYVYPTVSTISFIDNDSSWYADITLPEVREEANDNQRFNKMLYGEYNFYAPYYRQMIFEAYQQPETVLNQLVETPVQDINDAFQYYMAHFNQGRPFFLMGHSQGSQVLIELLKKGMTAEQSSEV